MTYENLYDFRFAFTFDDPFEHDSDKHLKRKLRDYISENAETFTEIDCYDDSRYLILCPEVTTLYGKDVSNGDVSTNQLTREVKLFLKDISGLSKDLTAWARDVPDIPDAIANSNDNDDINDNDNDITVTNSDFDASDSAFEPNIIPSMPRQFSSSYGAGLHYDISNDKCLSYDEVCKLCLNIARTKLVAENTQKDETVIALEREKRKKLTHEIMRYKSNKLIDPLIDADLSELTLEQLETTLEQCIRYQEHYKTLELFKRGFNASGTIYDAVFPQGIPIGKDKRLCFKGVGKEILSTLFNATSTTGIAFQNILDKNNIHVSDELLTLVAFGEICLSKVEIKTIKPEEQDDNEDEDVQQYTDDYEEDLMDIDE